MEWLAKLAPTAATLLGSPLAGMAVSALGDILGLSNATKESVTEALKTASLSDEQVAKLKEIDAQLKIRCKELDVKLDEIAAGDRNSARQMQITNRSLIPALLTLVTVGGFFTLLIGAAAGKWVLTGSDVMMLLLGVLARETASVYQFWFGSSSGSQTKTDMMAKK